MLYSAEFGAGDIPTDLGEDLPDVPESPPEYALRIVEGVRAEREALDAAIGGASHNWRVERMSLIDRNVLRIGAWEILFEESLPAAVVINEAVEVARRYGDTDSWSFVNGVLDAIARTAAAS